MPTLRMILSLAVILGAFAHLDVFGSHSIVGGAMIGGIIGVFFGLVFGGATGRWLDRILGPEEPEKSEHQRTRTKRK